MSDSVKDIIIAIVCSSAIFSFIQFMLTRRDNKKNIEVKLGQKIDEVHNEVVEVKQDVTYMSDRLEEHKATLARTHILRFADELRTGTHSKEYFQQQVLDIDTYNHYCETHPDFANGLTRMASEYIQDEYRKQYLNNE